MGKLGLVVNEDKTRICKVPDETFDFLAAIEPTLRTTLNGLLRRFVSGRWIAVRLGRDID
jgi:hypothetical protein